ncbi:SDR family NAD(P)-dependent oxidoreductase [Deinococcus budaensis]|uniref:NAD(P)-dependent dehydrogenase (Short-subunit alcohol dehydrogenase family) n=1 Tax=Deinococcus budaensis TaxID=1665626 RepID=A0A7W8LNX6_9DEIO|nr:SDR family NAD(P)-dependent oxidoreductase [Deinococcus budaensis]MBB5233193.1 NAD(P)-dependent dehydrogenase (short-subunit alcohol dehydrogenase family) [Deinococcus budaensis]
MSLARLLLSPPACRDPGVLRAAVAGRPVLVTGASSGIGEAAARQLGAAGAEVLLLARRAGRLEEVAAGIRAGGGRAHVYPADLADPGDVKAVAARIGAEFPDLWAVVSNAGKSVRRLALEGAARNDLGRLLAVNLSGPAALLLALLPGMLERGGVIVNVSSVSARQVGAPRWGAYQGSKAGFDLWLHALGAEVRGQGVRVASVYLPLVRTPMIAPTRAYRFLPALSADEAAHAALLPLVRPVVRVAPWWLRPVEVAGLLAPGLLGRGLARLEDAERRWSRR